MDAPSPHDVMRWSCQNCETDQFYDRPDSLTELQDEMDDRVCPVCGADEFNPAVAVMTQLFRMMNETGNLLFTGTPGEDPTEALDQTEVGTHISQGHPILDPPEDPHSCVCDWCGDEMDAGQMITAMAFRHPETDQPDTWVLYELYCDDCDIDRLLYGSVFSHDVLLHGFLDQHGEMYTVTDLAVIEESPPGEKIDL